TAASENDTHIRNRLAKLWMPSNLFQMRPFRPLNHKAGLMYRIPSRNVQAKHRRFPRVADLLNRNVRMKMPCSLHISRAKCFLFTLWDDDINNHKPVRLKPYFPPMDHSLTQPPVAVMFGYNSSRGLVNV